MTKPQDSCLDPAKPAPAPFRFKRFSVRQEYAAMKIGFDGILLGAWCYVEGYKRILDVGTGTGLIAMMLAQRTEGSSLRDVPASSIWIDAIEVDEGAAADANYNFKWSPWTDRLRLFHAKFQTWQIDQGQKYDLLVCNPPFFSSHVAATPRAVARQTSQLTLPELFERASSLLEPRGRVCLIVPFDQEHEAIEQAGETGFFHIRKLIVRSLPQKPPHRVLMEFERERSKCQVDEIVIEQSHHVYTPEFRRLARDFYLRF